MADKQKEESLECKVKTWLNGQGYPLEYKTYQAFHKFTSHASLSTYVESAAGKPREIDVYAQQSHVELGKRSYCIRIICECKSSKKHPWVLLYGSSEDSDLVFDWMNTPRSITLDQIPKMDENQAEELRGTYFFTKQPLAHNLVEGLKQQKDNRDSAYDALRKISHAAWDWIEYTEKNINNDIYSMIFPCIVVDTPLYAASYNPKTQEVEITPIEYGRICWAGCHDGTNIDVVHANALQKYAKKVGNSFVTILRFVRTVVEYGPGSP